MGERLVVGADNKRYWIPEDGLQQALQAGYRDASPDELQQQRVLETQTKEYGSAEGIGAVGQGLAGYVAGLAKGTGTGVVYAPNPQSDWSFLGLPAAPIRKAAKALIAPELTDEEWDKKVFEAVQGYAAANPKASFLGEQAGSIATFEAGGEVLGALGGPIKRALGIGAEEGAKAIEQASKDVVQTPRTAITKPIAGRVLRDLDLSPPKDVDLGELPDISSMSENLDPTGVNRFAHQGMKGPQALQIAAWMGSGKISLEEALLMMKSVEGQEQAARAAFEGGTAATAKTGAGRVLEGTAPTNVGRGIADSGMGGTSAGLGGAPPEAGASDVFDGFSQLESPARRGMGPFRGLADVESPQIREMSAAAKGFKPAWEDQTRRISGSIEDTLSGMGTKRVFASEPLPQLGPAGQGAVDAAMEAAARADASAAADMTKPMTPFQMGGTGPAVDEATAVAKTGDETATLVRQQPIQVTPPSTIESAVRSGMEAKTPKGKGFDVLDKVVAPTAGDMVLAAMQGASHVLNQANFSRDPKLTAQQVLWGAATSALVGGVASGGIRGMSGLLAELSLPSTMKSSTAFGTELKPPSMLGKFLVDSEAKAGIRAVTSGEGIPTEALERAGGPAQMWSIWKDELVGKMSMKEKMNFSSPEFQQVVAKKLETVSREHGDLLAKLDKSYPQGALRASDVMQPIDAAIADLEQRLLRDHDIAGLEKLRTQVGQKLGLEVGPSGETLGLDRGVTLGQANEIARLIDDANGSGARMTTLGRELNNVRNQIDKVVEQRASQLMGPNESVGMNELAAARAKLFAFQTLHEAIREVPAAAVKSFGGDIAGAGRAFSFAGLSLGLGHPVVAAGQLVGFAAGRVMRRYGDLIAAEFLGKAANMAAVDAGSQSVARRFESGIVDAAKGTAPKTARRMTDKEVIGLIDDINRMTPEALVARAQKMGGSLGADLPDVASHLASTAVIAFNYLKEHLPKPIPVPRTPQYERRYDPGDLRQFRDRVEMVDQPERTLMQHIADKDISPEHVDALRTVYNPMHNEARRLLMQHFLELGKLEQPQFRIAWLFDVPVDAGAHPEVFMVIQNARATADQMRQAMAGAPPPQNGNMRIAIDPAAASLRAPSKTLQQGPNK